MFKFTNIQVGRQLSEEEVTEINYITKRRAFRYVAAAEKEWLFPEPQLRTENWRKLGDGYLLMPEPRDIFLGGDIIIGYEDGSSDVFGTYGHRPWQKGYKEPERDHREAMSLERFKAEWASMHGPKYRGSSFKFGTRRHPPVSEDSPDMHQQYLALDKKQRNRPGERKRRRRLRRDTRQ